MSNSLPQDHSARQAALDPARSFAVSAPAGSGKTGLITQRLLKLLSLCDHPEEVLAITFTRKAAGEMQDRVLQALWSAKEQAQPNNPHEHLTWQLAQAVLQHDQQQQWNLLQCPQRLRVQTIDSLSSSISQQLPLVNGFGATPSPTNTPETAYRQAVHQLLRELETESNLREDLSRLLRHLDNNLGNFEKLLISLLAKRDQWLTAILHAGQTGARAYLEHVLQQIIVEALEKAAVILQLHASELALIGDWAGGNLQHSAPDNSLANLHGIIELPKAQLSELNNWKLIADFLLTGGDTFRKRLTHAEGFPAAKDNKESADYKLRFGKLTQSILEIYPNAEFTLAQIRQLPPMRFSESQWELLDSLTRILPRLAAQLNIVFAELGETDFTAISQAALTALGDSDAPSDISLQLDYRIRHILVDEFQDTSSSQLQLLEKLTAGWQSGDGRSLFIVGDGMQSCYGFRNANVGIFLEARKDGIGGLPLEALDLTVNFRSQAGIVEWVNQHFQHAFPAEDDIGHGAVKYSSSVAYKPTLEQTSVSLFVSSYGNDQEISYRNSADENDDDEDNNLTKYFAELYENEAIAQKILQLRQQHPEDSIAILARSRPHLQTLFPALSRLGLSWQATDIDSLAQRMAIVDLTSLTRALLYPNDRIAWLAILRAPWCGLNLHDMHCVANAAFPIENPTAKPNDFPILWQQIMQFSQIENLSTAGKHILARFVSILQPALKQRQRKPLRQWLEGIWLTLGGPAALLDSQDIYDVPNFFALIDQHQLAGNIKNWNEFKTAVEKLYAIPRKNADTKLHVMTMHKSKGLEFDHVIIPRLHKLPRNDEQALLLWKERVTRHGERQLLLSSLSATGRDTDSLYKYIKDEIALQSHYEATRLFYVGCTRAVKHLYLFASLPTKEIKNESGESQSALKPPSTRSLLGSIWSTAQHEIQIIQPTSNTIKPPLTKNEKSGLQHIVRISPEWVVSIPEDESPLKKYRGKEYDDDENTPNEDIQQLSRYTGTLIHRTLQTFVQSEQIKEFARTDFNRWNSTQRYFWELSLKQKGFNAAEIEIAIAKIEQAALNTLTDLDGQWILNNQHLQSTCELAITHQQGNAIDLKLRENIIDRTFICNETRWIIDYKSSEPTDSQNINDFIASEFATYSAQLARYRSCFEALGETNIKVALYFPLLNCPKKLYEIPYN